MTLIFKASMLDGNISWPYVYILWYIQVHAIVRASTHILVIYEEVRNEVTKYLCSKRTVKKTFTSEQDLSENENGFNTWEEKTTSNCMLFKFTINETAYIFIVMIIKCILFIKYVLCLGNMWGPSSHEAASCENPECVLPYLFLDSLNS